MIEGLAKKIGYAKVRAFTTVGDPGALKDFIQKTGLRVKIYVSPEPFKNNKVTAVPVTIIETKDGKSIRFDGLTENFIGVANASAGMPEMGQIAPQNVQGGKQQCGAK